MPEAPSIGVANIADQIILITGRIVRGFDPRRIVLFGSQARGDADARSDLDLLVVLDETTNRRDTGVAILRSLGDLTVPVDIIVTTQEEIVRRGHIVGTVLRSALREGTVIYERP